MRIRRLTLRSLRTDEYGRIGLSVILTTLGAVALFGVMAVVGYSVTAPETASPTIVAAEVEAVPIQTGADSDSVDDVVAEESLRLIRESGAVDAAAIEAIADSVGAGGGTASRTLSADGPVSDEAAIAPSETPDDAVPAPGPLPVPDEVLGDDDLIRNGIDWDRLEVTETIPDLRFDPCAGSTPGLPALPWCPTGTGATIVPLDDGIEGEPLGDEFFVLTNPPYPYANRVHPSCDLDDDSFRIVVITNRPATFVIAAWNGTGEGRPAAPPSFEAATSISEVAEWEAANAAAPGFGSRIVHCFEIPSVTYGRVVWNVEGTSIYEADDGATDSDEDAISWWNPTGGKPPSALVAATPQTLYVRAWNRSAASEQIFVQARPESTDGCDNLGDVSMVGSAPGSVQGILDRMIPIRGDLTGWPWAPAWDEIEIHRLSLEPGTPYDICIYWVDDSGPSFNPAAVTRTEAAEVVPPSPNTLTIRVVGGGFAVIEGDDPRINVVGASAILSGPATFDPDRPTNACRGAWDANSNAGTIDVPIGAAGELCTTDDVTSLILQGGMRITTSATDSLGERYRRSSWVTLPRNLFQCGLACGQQEMSVTVPLPWVAPRAITGHFDWPFAFEVAENAVPIDDGETGQNGPPVGAIFLDLIFTPTGGESSRWYLGEIGEVDQSLSSLPLRPQIEVTFSHPRDAAEANSRPGIYFPDGYPGLPSGVVEVRVEADRPVSVNAAVGAYELDTVCLRTPTSPSYSSSDLRTIHTFRLTGLCTASYYVANVEATDDTGLTAEIFGLGPADGTTPVPFSTAALVLNVEAQLDIDPSAFGPGDPGARLHVSPESSGVFVGAPGPTWRPAIVRLSPSRSREAEEAASGWTHDEPYYHVLCADPDPGAGAFGSPMPLTGPAFPGAHFGDTAEIQMLAYRWSAPVVFQSLAGGRGLDRCSNRLDEVRYDLERVVDIVDLLDGISIASEDGLFTLTVRGQLAP